eukprot:GGOE01021535.1.p1 GENE.GGOE01021535.1~~GGOE01021535.1.p1  ORF type:complete len:162 (+),score=1.08 GGOE01021535.1:138-623(+)
MKAESCGWRSSLLIACHTRSPSKSAGSGRKPKSRYNFMAARRCPSVCSAHPLWKCRIRPSAGYRSPTREATEWLGKAGAMEGGGQRHGVEEAPATGLAIPGEMPGCRAPHSGPHRVVHQEEQPLSQIRRGGAELRPEMPLIRCCPSTACWRAAHTAASPSR